MIHPGLRIGTPVEPSRADGPGADRTNTILTSTVRRLTGAVAPESPDPPAGHHRSRRSEAGEATAARHSRSRSLLVVAGTHEMGQQGSRSVQAVQPRASPKIRRRSKHAWRRDPDGDPSTSTLHHEESTAWLLSPTRMKIKMVPHRARCRLGMASLWGLDVICTSLFPSEDADRASTAAAARVPPSKPRRRSIRRRGPGTSAEELDAPVGQARIRAQLAVMRIDEMRDHPIAAAEDMDLRPVNSDQRAFLRTPIKEQLLARRAEWG